MISHVNTGSQNNGKTYSVLCTFVVLGEKIACSPIG